MPSGMLFLRRCRHQEQRWSALIQHRKTTMLDDQGLHVWLWLSVAHGGLCSLPASSRLPAVLLHAVPGARAHLLGLLVLHEVAGTGQGERF